MRENSNEIKPGAEILVQIERILPGGAGLAHAEGLTLFVNLSAPGDLVRVQIDQIRGRIAFASIIEIIEPSSLRVTPECVYFGRCGGCDFQQLSYEAQLDAKVEIIRDCLRHIAGLDFQHPVPITPSPNIWKYRSSAQWKHDPLKGKLGYFERGSHNVCDVVECPILAPALQETLVRLRNCRHEGNLPANMKEFEAVAGDDGASVFPPFENDDTRDVSLQFGSDRYVFNAKSFFQVNHALLPSLIDAVMNEVQGDTALDLYCGAGLFTIPLSRKFTRVIGVEGRSLAADYARRNLAEANLNNAIVECSAVGDWLRQHAESITNVDFVLLDPPRSGVEKGVIESLLNALPRRITYVSCDPPTMARDLKPLLAAGYALDSIAAFDMFPQTHHVETVACLSEPAD